MNPHAIATEVITFIVTDLLEINTYCDLPEDNTKLTFGIELTIPVPKLIRSFFE